MRCVAVPNPITRKLGLGRADCLLESLAAMPLPTLLARLDGAQAPKL
jgi:hypothetical protein